MDFIIKHALRALTCVRIRRKAAVLRRLQVVTMPHAQACQSKSPAHGSGVGAKQIARLPPRHRSNDLIDLHIVDMGEGGKPPPRTPKPRPLAISERDLGKARIGSDLGMIKMILTHVAALHGPGFTGGQNFWKIARYGTDIKEEDLEAVFT